MTRAWMRFVAATVVAGIVTMIGVVFFFDPVASAEGPVVAPVPPPVALLVYLVLSVGLFHWLARRTGSWLVAAGAPAAAQFILVDVDFYLRGERGFAVVLVSALLIFATWASIAGARATPTTSHAAIVSSSVVVLTTAARSFSFLCSK